MSGISTGAIFGLVIASFVIILLILFVIGYMICPYYDYFIYPTKRGQLKHRNEQLLDEDLELRSSVENDTQMALNSFPINGSSTSKFKKKIHLITNDDLLSDFNSLLENFDEISGQVKQLNASKNSDDESLSNNTMLIQKISNHEKIQKVCDPFSENFIVLGGIVVVVNEFHGVKSNEFKSLQKGDLLRVVKFYITDDNEHCKSLKLNKKQLISDADQSSFDDSIDKADSVHESVWCTGVLLNSYLEFDDDHLCIKLKTEEGNHEINEIVKDFPLKVVSLETTVLRNYR